MNNLFIANEALGLTARIALLIRSKVHSCGIDSSGKPTAESLELFWLGDALHNIGHLYGRIDEGDFNAAIESANRQIRELDDYLSRTRSTASRAVAIEARDFLKSVLKQLMAQTTTET
jgi:hypothetical protein